MLACIVVLLALILLAMLWPQGTREMLSGLFITAIGLSLLITLLGLGALGWSYFSHLSRDDRISEAIAATFVVLMVWLVIENARREGRKSR